MFPAITCFVNSCEFWSVTKAKPKLWISTWIQAAPKQGDLLILVLQHTHFIKFLYILIVVL